MLYLAGSGPRPIDFRQQVGKPRPISTSQTQETLKSITGQLLAFAFPCAAEASFKDVVSPASFEPDFRGRVANISVCYKNKGYKSLNGKATSCCQAQFFNSPACVAPATIIRLRGEKEIHDRTLVLA